MRGAIAMINRVIFVAVVLCLAMIGQAVAEIVDGNKLFGDCRDGDDPSARDRATKWGTCFGYASGGRRVGPSRSVLHVKRGDGRRCSRRRQTLPPKSPGKASSVRASVDRQCAQG